MRCSVIALVFFSVPSEAKRAFNHLSYRKYQHTPLSLEYLPTGLWSGECVWGGVRSREGSEGYGG